MNKKITMRQKVMDFIKAAGPDGLRFTDIQRFIVEELHGLDYDEKDMWGKRAHRGWWVAPLCRHGGVLQSCVQVGKRYVHPDLVEIGSPQWKAQFGECQPCPKTMKPQPDLSQLSQMPRTQVSRVRIDRETGEAHANFAGEYVHAEVAARLETDLKLKSSECEALRREIIELKKYRTCCERIMGNIATLENDIAERSRP